MIDLFIYLFTWVGDLLSPDAPRPYKTGPLCPMSNHRSSVTAKVTDGPQAHALDVRRLQEKGAELRMSERGQSLTFAENVGRGFLFHSTPSTHWTIH